MRDGNDRPIRLRYLDCRDTSLNSLPLPSDSVTKLLENGCSDLICFSPYMAINTACAMLSGDARNRLLISATFSTPTGDYTHEVGASSLPKELFTHLKLEHAGGCNKKG
jgi:hypothetical protein